MRKHIPSTRALLVFDAVARHHGVDMAPDRLVHDYALGDQPLSPRQLLRIAKDGGLRARSSRMGWKELLKLRDAYPVLAQLSNGNWVIVAGPAETVDGKTPDAVEQELMAV